VETSEAKVGEIWGLDYYLLRRIIPSRAIIQRHRLWLMRHAHDENERMCALRRAGAEHGIPTLISKESASTSRVKAIIITTQSDSSP